MLCSAGTPARARGDTAWLRGVECEPEGADTLGELTFLIPLVVTALTALIAAAVLGTYRTRLKLGRISGLLLAGQIALVPISWLLIRAAPERPDNDEGGGATCPDAEAWTGTFYMVLFGSCLLGGGAVGGAYAADRPDAGRAVGFAVFAAVVPYVVAGLWIAAALCGGTWN